MSPEITGKSSTGIVDKENFDYILPPEIEAVPEAKEVFLKAMEQDGTFALLPKKEVIKLNLEIEKLEKFMGGITEMKKQPAAMFIVDPRKERIAVLEAKKLPPPLSSSDNAAPARANIFPDAFGIEWRGSSQKYGA